MRLDWTINISDILLAASFLVSAIVILWKMHSRLLVLETWMKLEGNVAQSLVKITTLFEMNQMRVDELEKRLNRHHEDVNLHLHGAR